MDLISKNYAIEGCSSLRILTIMIMITIDDDISRERVGFSIGSRQVDDRRNTDTGVFIFINMVIIMVIMITIMIITIIMINKVKKTIFLNLHLTVMTIMITIIIIILLVDACSKLCQRQGCHTFAYRFLIKLMRIMMIKSQ